MDNSTYTFRLKHGYKMVRVNMDGEPNSWEMWHGDAFLHDVVFRASNKQDLLVEAVKRGLVDNL